MHPVAVAARSRFHTVLALALAALVFVGFARSYYLAPLFGAPSHTLLVRLHAASFTAWLAVFVLQAWLVATRRNHVHGGLTAPQQMAIPSPPCACSPASPGPGSCSGVAASGMDG